MMIKYTKEYKKKITEREDKQIKVLKKKLKRMENY